MEKNNRSGYASLARNDIASFVQIVKARVNTFAKLMRLGRATKIVKKKRQNGSWKIYRRRISNEPRMRTLLWTRSSRLQKGAPRRDVAIRLNEMQAVLTLHVPDANNIFAGIAK